MRKQSFITTLIIVLPLAAIASGALLYFAKLGREFMGNLPQFVTAFASEHIEGDLTIGEIDISANKIILEDITLKDLNGDHETILVIPSLKISYSLSSIIRRKADAAGSIRSVEIQEPKIMLDRCEDGAWNIAKIYKPEPSEEPITFGGRIHIKSASIVFRDKLYPGEINENKFSNVNALIDLSRMPNAKFTIAGKGAEDRLGDFRIKGQYDFDANSFSADLDLLNANASYWTIYPYPIGLDVPSGRVGGKISFSMAENDPIRYFGALRLEEGSVSFEQIRGPVEDVQGDIILENDFVSMRLDGRIGGSPISVLGRVIDFSNPQLAIEINSDKANVREIIGLSEWKEQFAVVELPRSGKVRAFVSGSNKNPAVNFHAESAALRYNDFKAANVEVHGSYFDGKLDINSAQASFCDGILLLSGMMDFREGVFGYFEGSATGVNLEKLPNNEHDVKAKADVNFQASYQPDDLKVHLIAKANRLEYDEWEFDKPAAEVSYVNGDITIRELSAEIFGGPVAVMGDIVADGALDLNAVGSDINLAEVAELFGDTPAVGRGQFAGKLTGDLSSPKFQGQIEAHRTVVSGYGIEKISGGITANLDEIALDNLTIHDYQGNITINGKVENPLESPTMRIALTADSIDIRRFAQLSPMLSVKGFLSANISVTGDPGNPLAKGSVTVENGSYNGIAFDKAESWIAYHDDQLRLEQFKASQDESIITATADFQLDGSFSVSFQGDDIALQQFSKYLTPYAYIDGKASVSGYVGGAFNNPQASIGVNSDSIRINNQSFANLSAKATLDKNIIVLTKFALDDGDGRYLVPEMSVDIAESLIEFQAQVQNGRGERIIALLRSSPSARLPDSALMETLDSLPKPLSGMFNGNLSGAIEWDEKGFTPNIRAEIAMANLKIGPGSAQTAQLNGYWRDDAILIEEMFVSDGETLITAEGGIGPGDNVALRIQTENFSLERLKDWADFPYNLSGNADVTIVVGGKKSKPTADMYVAIIDPVIRGVEFDRLNSRFTAGTSEDGEGRIDIADFTLTLGNHDLRLTGHIPMDWHERAISADRPMLIQSKFGKDSLDVLSKFTGIEIGTAPSGNFAGIVKLDGNIESPNFSGSLEWSGGKFQIPRLQTPFEEINARIALVGDKILIEELTGVSAEGGSFDIQGDVKFAEMQPNLNLAVLMSNLKISGEDISNLYNEKVNATLHGNLSVIDDWRTPLISGRINVPEGSAELRMIEVDSEPEKAEYAVNPRFEINVQVGEDVSFKTSRFKSPMQGNMNIRGSLSNPYVEGRLSIADGSILFPLSQFKILPGSVIVLRQGPNQQQLVTVDMRAQTRLTSVSAWGQRKRYVVTMEARGSLDRMDMKFDSSPPDLSEHQMLALVTGQSHIQSILARETAESLGEGLSGLFTSALMPSLFDPIGEVFETTLGLEEFTLEMGYREPLMLRIGEQLMDGLYLDYSTVLGARPDYSDSAYELRLSYRFKRGIELGIQTDDNRDIHFGVAGRLRF